MTDAAEFRRHSQDALARGNLDLAVAYLQTALRQDPADRESYHTLGRLLRLAGRGESAAAWYKACLHRYPDDSVARMGLAALGQGPAPDRLPDDVVLYIFDRNANVYESNMEGLAYRIPETLTPMLAAEKGTARGELDILDLGCGSGWCGPLLRPFARRLVGLDLSPAMLDLARAKNVYDELVEGEILGALASGRLGMFDAIVAANVVLYFGKLDPLAEAITQSLKPSGVFIFDVEKGAADRAEFHSAGRFTHGRQLVERVFAPPLYARSRIQETVMRTEAGRPVHALCCVATTPGS